MLVADTEASATSVNEPPFVLCCNWYCVAPVADQASRTGTVASSTVASATSPACGADAVGGPLGLFTVQDCDAGVASRLPTASWARTWNVCAPSARPA